MHRYISGQTDIMDIMDIMDIFIYILLAHTSVLSTLLDGTRVLVGFGALVVAAAVAPLVAPLVVAAAVPPLVAPLVVASAVPPLVVAVSRLHGSVSTPLPHCAETATLACPQSANWVAGAWGDRWTDGWIDT